MKKWREELSDYVNKTGCDRKIKKIWHLERMRVGGGFLHFRFSFFLRCESQCLNADGKKPAHRKRVPIQRREEGQQMGQASEVGRVWGEY